jgi:septal ring-binding cell division protein DamX
MDRAERDERRFAEGKKGRYAIQLELVCEIGSLVEAFQHDRGGNMWVVTTSFQGKACFRVLWGHYATPEAGRRALAGAPAFFSTPKNHPAVAAVR